MKSIIYIFILLVIFMLIRSMSIELKEYFEEDQCKKLSGKKFSDYIQQKVMNDLKRSEDKNSMVTYKIGDPKSFYKLKKNGENYINQPFDTEVNDQINSYINLQEGEIIIPACKKGFLGSNCNSQINIFGASFIRNENEVDFSGTIYESIPTFIVAEEIGGIIGSSFAYFLITLIGKKLKKEVSDSFGRFKYGKNYAITNKDGKIINASYYMTFYLKKYYKKEMDKSKKKLEEEKEKNGEESKKIKKIEKKIIGYENIVKDYDNKLKQITKKFEEDSEQYNMTIEDYLEDIDKNSYDLTRNNIKNILFNGITSNLSYECRTSIGSLGKENPYIPVIAAMLNCYHIKPKGDDKLYSLKFVLVEDTDNPPHNAGNIQAFEISQSPF